MPAKQPVITEQQICRMNPEASRLRRLDFMNETLKLW